MTMMISSSMTETKYNTFNPSEFDAEDDDAQWYDDEDEDEDLESQGYSIEDDDDFYDEDEEDQYQDEPDEIFDIDF